MIEQKDMGYLSLTHNQYMHRKKKKHKKHKKQKNSTFIAVLQFNQLNKIENGNGEYVKETTTRP